MRIKDAIPTFWFNQMLYRLREEDKAIEKIKKANLTKEEKAMAAMLIHNGLYKSADIYIGGCQEFARTRRCGTHTIADIAEDLPGIYGEKEFWERVKKK